jgi:hypothetical protein
MKQPQNPTASQSEEFKVFTWEGGKGMGLDPDVASKEGKSLETSMSS